MVFCEVTPNFRPSPLVTRVFSLVETTLALGIVAFALIPLMGLPGSGLGTFQCQRTKAARRVRGTKGFSLLELLVVIGLIALLTLLLSPAVGSLQDARKLTKASDEVRRMLNMSRAEAMTAGVPSKWLMLSDAGTSADFRAQAVFRISEPGGGVPAVWEQVGRWESLPPGVVIDPNFSPAAGIGRAISESFPFLPPPGTMIFQGATVAPDRVYSRIFLPDGSVASEVLPTALRLVLGEAEGGNIRYKIQPSERSSEIVLLPETGRTVLLK